MRSWSAVFSLSSDPFGDYEVSPNELAHQVPEPLCLYRRRPACTTTEQFENVISDIAEGSADCRSSIR